MPRPELPPQPDHTSALRAIVLGVIGVIALIAAGLYLWLG